VCHAPGADVDIAERPDGSCGAKTADGIGARSANHSIVCTAKVRRNVVGLRSSSLVGTAGGQLVVSWWFCFVDAGHY
jgi:hypothetical protein